MLTEFTKQTEKGRFTSAAMENYRTNKFITLIKQGTKSRQLYNQFESHPCLCVVTLQKKKICKKAQLLIYTTRKSIGKSDFAFIEQFQDLLLTGKKICGSGTTLNFIFLFLLC